MEINERLRALIEQPDTTPLSMEESAFILSEYVRIRKGRTIHPFIETRYGPFIAHREVGLMHELLNVAIVWFRNNKDEQE